MFLLFQKSAAAQECAFSSCDTCLNNQCSWRADGSCVMSCDIFTNLFEKELECFTLKGDLTVGELCLRASAVASSAADGRGSGLVGDDRQACGVTDGCIDCLEGGCVFSDGICEPSCMVNATFCLVTDDFPANLTSSEICNCVPQENRSLPAFCMDGNFSEVTSVAPRPSPFPGNFTGGNFTGGNFTGNETLSPSPTLSPSTLIQADEGEEFDDEAEVLPLGIPCNITEDCDHKDFFCSSASKTCVDLNCTNWLVGTPEGALPYGEEPCLQEVEGIDAEAGFCSPVDGMCHDYTCEEWYEFGPVAFTGFDPNNPVDLECGDYENGSEDSMNGVVFGCRPYTPGNKAPISKTWTHYFNQKCTAKPRDGHEFTCYNYKDNTDYRDFLRQVARLNPPFCDPEIYGDLTSQPDYWYNVIMAQERQGTEILHKAGRENTTHTSQFDPSEADSAMYAYVLSDRPVPEQTRPGEGGESSATSMKASMLIGLVLSALVCWFGLI